MLKKRPVLSFILVSVAVLSGLLGILIHWAFYDLNRINKDELLIESSSPDGRYTVNLYASRGGATVSNGIVGELVLNGSTKKRKNIYWDLGEAASIDWLANDIVRINNQQLKLPKGKYDYRHQ